MSKPLFVIAIFFSLPVFSQVETVPGFDKLLYISEKDTMAYRLLQPEQQAKKNFPLVIFLHGIGERGNDNQAQIKHIADLFLDPDTKTRFPGYVLAPQCPAKMMWARHDKHEGRLIMREKPTRAMAMLIALIDKIEKDFPVDPARIYVTGLSMGGYGTWDLIARFPDRFAAAVPICGGGDPETAFSIKHLPLWAFHGALDKVVLPQQSRVMIKALQDAGGTPGYTEYPDTGHDSWVNAYSDPNLLPWMFDQYLGKKSKVK